MYPVGPVLNLDGVDRNPHDDDVRNWLDGPPLSSELFLCFGSANSFEEVEMKEIPHGLERSGHHILWCLRRPPPPEKPMK